MFENLAISAHPNLGESINFLISGFTIVLLTLLVLAVVTSLVGKLFVLLKPKAAPVSAARAAPSSTVPPFPAATEDARVLAAITAAVHTVVKDRAVVRRVVAVNRDTTWSQEGRRRIHQSHNLR